MSSPSTAQSTAVRMLEDPSVRSVARVYAEALLESAGAQADDVQTELASLVTDVLDRSPELERIFASKLISRDDKVAMVSRSLRPSCSPLVSNFLGVLADHDRLELLRAAADEFRRERDQRASRVQVTVRSATPLSPAEADHIRQTLATKFHCTPVMEIETNPSLLGGLVVQIGDTVYDGSLRSRLKQLVGQVRQRYLHEIQSGRDRFSHPEGN